MALMTCEKCGRQYYGVGCPACDFPPQSGNVPERKPHRLLGVLFMALGCFVAVGSVMKMRGDLEDEPTWVVYVVAVIFFLAGAGLVAGPKGRASALIGAVICAGLSSLGFWVALGFAREPLEGGLALIPAPWNQAIGRLVFGFGALCTAAMAVWGFRRFVKPPDTK